MILHIEVDGFRSLVRFKLEIRTGLNLLVGPNGSGKTNIISFLEFLAQLAANDISSIVGNLGGSGAVFRKLGANRYQSQIKSRVYGKVNSDLRYRSPRKDKEPDGDDKFTLYYEYSFTMQLSDDRESVFFAKQSLKLKLAENEDIAPASIEDWGADIQVSGNADGSVVCHCANLESAFKQEGWWARRDKPDLVPEQQLEKMASSDVSLIGLAYAVLPSEYAVPLLSDFSRGIIFNPHPSRIRTPEDSAKTPGIRPDGSGLYASLFALKRAKPKSDLGPWRFFYRPSDVPFSSTIKLDRAVEFFRLAYPSIANLAVSNDQFENTIRVRITLDGPAKSQIPLAALSDGTLKWMAFVTAIFTNANILAIEEPENFVHPFVQREAIRLVRDQLQDNSYMFMSSHSETILNAAEPEEVIVVSSRQGRTEARRVTNPRHLRELIGQSGFGLGFYYLSGALEDA